MTDPTDDTDHTDQPAHGVDHLADLVGGAGADDVGNDDRLVVQFPSDDFPPPPAFRLAIPRDWEAVPMPDAEMAVRARTPTAGFHANVTVRVRRLAASPDAGEDLAQAVRAGEDRPGVQVVVDEARPDGPTPARRTIVRYAAPDGTALQSHHLAVYVPASERVANVVVADGTWALAAGDEVGALVTSVVESLTVRLPVAAAEEG